METINKVAPRDSYVCRVVLGEFERDFVWVWATESEYRSDVHRSEVASEPF